VRKASIAAVLALALMLVAPRPQACLGATHHVYSEGASTPLSILQAAGTAATPLPGELVTPLPANALVLSFSLTPVLNAASLAYGGVPPDPRSLQRLPNGNLLVADRNSSLVGEFDASGRAVWTYTPQDAQGDEAPLVKPFSARRFTRLGQSLTLVVDRNGKRVFVVDQSKRVVWQYGKALTSGNAVDRLVDPFYAEYVKAQDPADDTILITEDKSVDATDPSEWANRVIEVRYADYRAGASDDGFTKDSIVWTYGSGVQGAGVNELFKPHSAQRLKNGDTLIDDADNDRVIQVRTADYDPALPNDGYHGGAHPSIVWQYGVTGVQSADVQGPTRDVYLADPNYAERLTNGHTLIADTGHNRILDVDPYHDARVLQLDRPHQPVDPGVEPRAVALSGDGALLIADSAKNQVLRAAFTGVGGADVPIVGTAVSRPLDLGSASRKRFLSIDWGVDRPAGSGLTLYYRIDPPHPGTGQARDGRPTGKGWVSAGASGTFTLPRDSVGRTIQYFARLSTTDRWVTPVLTLVKVVYTRWTGAGSGEKEKPVTTVQGASMGGATGYADSGAVRLAAGTGNGDGSESGSGGIIGPTGVGTPAEPITGEAGPAAQLPATGPAVNAPLQVTGQRVGSDSAGGASQHSGGHVKGQPTTSAAVWVVLGAGVLLCAWCVTALIAERRRRALAGYDHTIVRPSDARARFAR
jgi:hypothetical protein